MTSSTPATPARPRWRVWAARVSIVAGLLAAVALARPLFTVLGFVRADWVLDGVVVAVALDWRDFGFAVAQDRLQHEIDRRSVRAQVADRDCALSVEPEEVRRVACAWKVRVAVPLREEPWTLAFSSTARIDRNGVLLR